MNWQKPRRPKKRFEKGLVVIHCDDGEITNYTKWMKVIQRAIQKNDQFHAKNNAIYSPCVNAGFLEPPYNGRSTLGNNFKIMTEKEMKYIQDNGGEILSHGYVHSYFDYTNISQDVNVGDSSIYYSDRFNHFHPGQEVYIEDNENKEFIKVVEFEKNEPNGDNRIILSEPLKNSYSEGATLHLSEKTLEQMTKGLKDYLGIMGIDCNNHINPWYRSSAISDRILKKHFNSVIKTTGYVETPENADVYSLVRLGGVENTDISHFKEQLDRAHELDGVAFIQGHSGINAKTLERLEQIIDYSYEKGLKVVKHQDSINHILSKQM